MDFYHAMPAGLLTVGEVVGLSVDGKPTACAVISVEPLGELVRIEYEVLFSYDKRRGVKQFPAEADITRYCEYLLIGQ